MLTRRAMLVGALTTGALLRPRTSRAKASQPATFGRLDSPRQDFLSSYAA